MADLPNHIVEAQAEAILDLIAHRQSESGRSLPRDEYRIGDWSPGVTRWLHSQIHPDARWDGGRSHSARKVVAGLCYLEQIGLIRLIRQSDPTHGAGERTGQVGSAILWIEIL